MSNLKFAPRLRSKQPLQLFNGLALRSDLLSSTLAKLSSDQSKRAVKKLSAVTRHYPKGPTLR